MPDTEGVLDTKCVLDASMYPHIADAILGALIADLGASRSARDRRHLLALRRINRAMRERVDVRLAYRFVLKGAPFHPAFTGLLLDHVLYVPSEPTVLREPFKLRMTPPNHIPVQPAPRVLRTRRVAKVVPKASTPAPENTEQRIRRACSLLSHTRVLDVGADLAFLQNWEPLAKAEHLAAFFPNIQTMRIRSDRFPTSRAGRPLPPAVWFERWPS